MNNQTFAVRYIGVVLRYTKFKGALGSFNLEQRSRDHTRSEITLKIYKVRTDEVVSVKK